jgi:hypothetical protein
MKILIPVKRVVDYNVKIRVKADQSGVELDNIKMSMNPFDEIAVEEAVKLKESGKATELVAVTIGPAGAVDQLRTALALGVDRAIHVTADGVIEPLAVAKMLAAIAQKENPDLIIMGKQAIDDDANQTGQMLAALLDWPQATFASKVEFSGDAIHVTREIDGGLGNRCRVEARDHHHRFAPEYAALCGAAEHHEGPPESRSRRIRPTSLGVCRRAAPDTGQSDRTDETQGRHQGRRRIRTGPPFERRGKSPMSILILAEHDGADIETCNPGDRYRRGAVAATDPYAGPGQQARWRSRTGRHDQGRRKSAGRRRRAIRQAAGRNFRCRRAGGG